MFSFPKMSLCVVCLDCDMNLCREQGISGKAVTPFLLDQINRFTGGISLEASIF